MEYDPAIFDAKTMFIKRRMGRMLMFNKQILNWRKKYKAKGALKDSVNNKCNAKVTIRRGHTKNIFE